jgi:hypothetical protein
MSPFSAVVHVKTQKAVASKTVARKPAAKAVALKAAVPSSQRVPTLLLTSLSLSPDESPLLRRLCPRLHSRPQS